MLIFKPPDKVVFNVWGVGVVRVWGLGSISFSELFAMSLTHYKRTHRMLGAVKGLKA